MKITPRRVQQLYQKYRTGRGIKHTPSRRNNPQTNEYKKHRDKFESDREFMDCYNDRLHGALRLEWAETPNEAFIRKLRPGTVLRECCDCKGDVIMDVKQDMLDPRDNIRTRHTAELLTNFI